MTEKIIPQFIPSWDNKEIDAVMNVLNGDMLLENKLTREFEKKFAEFVKARFCITCTSGSVALFLALTARHPTYKKMITIPSHQGIFVHNAVMMAGHIPMIADISKNGSLNNIQNEAFTVHANGRIGETIILEDSCQSITHHTPDAISCHSFASSKHLTTVTGQGGAVCCDDKDIFDELSAIKDHGRTDRQQLKPMSDNFDRWGFNFKFSEAQSAFALVQLEKLPAKLKRLARLYNIVKERLDEKNNIIVHEETPSWYIDIFVKDPEDTISRLKKFGITAKRTQKPLHMQKMYVDTMSGNFPESDHFYDHCIYLPSLSSLTDEQMNYICDKVLESTK